MSSVGPRSEVRTHAPMRAGNGTSQMWSREIYGQLYSFTRVAMPNGDVRLFVRKFNGYIGGPEWACAWNAHRTYTFPAQRQPVRVSGGNWKGQVIGYSDASGVVHSSPNADWALDEDFAQYCADHPASQKGE